MEVLNPAVRSRAETQSVFSSYTGGKKSYRSLNKCFIFIPPQCDGALSPSSTGIILSSSFFSKHPTVFDSNI
ncbi:uncharacterized protein V6R79_023041 [Siganus canaliculatus]